MIKNNSNAVEASKISLKTKTTLQKTQYERTCRIIRIIYTHVQKAVKKNKTKQTNKIKNLSVYKSRTAGQAGIQP